MRDHLATFSLVTLHEISPTIVPKQPIEALPPYCGPRRPVAESLDFKGASIVTQFIGDDGQTIERTTQNGRIVSERVVAPA